MKKLFAIMLCICMLTGTAAYADVTSVVAEKEYELWTQSPSITCGLTSDDVRIYKALDQNLLELYPLTLIGDNYYFAICSYKMTDGGYNGKSKTTQFYLYTLYATDTGFIILSKVTAGNEYYWDRGYCFADISGKVNAAFYNNNNSEVPYYIVNPKGKYTNSNLDEYDEYFFITSSGKLYRMSENTEYGTEGYPYIKDKILYRGQNKYRRSSTTYYYYMSDGSTKASNSTPMFFKNGVITYGTETRVPVADMTASNGYTMYTEGFDSNTSFPLYMPIPGSDNLFFNTTDTYTYNSSVGKYYNYLKIDVFKSNNGIMSNVSSKTITTVSTSSVTYTYQKINDLDENYYTSKGLLVPSVAIGTTAVITKDGTVCPLDLDTTIYKNYVYPCTYNGHFSVIRSYNGSSTIYKKDTTNNNYYYWQAINEISFDVNGNKTITDDLELRIQSSPHTGQNGYFSSYSTWNNSSFTAISSNSVKSWWGRTLNNVFPDGRYVTASWTGVGSGISELWYNIYNADKTMRATGPTGYSGYFGSSFDRPDLIAWAVNNSKFIVCLGEIGNSFLKEYYRVAVVTETDTGEIVSSVELGEKNIIPPTDADTEIVQSTIDFGASDLPIGYNIKDNVIDSGKLDAILRDQVNSIRLNDIVILAKEGYQSGSQNTGVTLGSYSTYDYSFGSTYVRLYTNGQYFRWYCYYPENLTPGTYTKSIAVGDKTVYVTIKVICPPSNEGSTTVVF
jgi:hypothetical protein